MPEDRFLHPKCGHSQKVTMLTDLEFRVWTQYILSADDFGVMRATPAKIKADNEHLDNRSVRHLERSLATLLTCGLLDLFEHQGKAFVYQRDWQKWQKVEYPRSTNLPKPNEAALERCDEATRELFTKHPGGTRKLKTFQGRSEGVPNVSQKNPEGVPTTRAGAPAKRLTANGIRLAANGSEGSPRETDPPMDVWLRELQATYPQHRVTRNVRTEHAFVNAMNGASDGPVKAWEILQENLAANLASHEWRVKGMIPALEKYLADGLWQNVLPPSPPAAEQLSPRTMRMLGGA